MSSSYDSALVDTAMIEDPRLLTLPRGVRLLHLEALVWSKLRRTDGRIPAGALNRITDEDDPRQAAAQLAEAGVWSITDEGWKIDFSLQMTAAQVESRIESQRRAREQYEKRNPNRPRRGTDTSREQSDEESRDNPASLPARLPAKAEVGSRPERSPRGAAGPTGKVNGATSGPPVFTLIESTCKSCGTPFLGEGYRKGDEHFCSWKCRDFEESVLTYTTAGVSVRGQP